MVSSSSHAPSREARCTPGNDFASLALTERLGPDPTARNQRLDLGRRSLGDDASAVEDDDPIGQSIGFFEVVGREDDPGPGGRQVAERRPQTTPHLDVQAGRWLVEEEKLGVATHGDGEQDASLLAARQFAVQASLEPVQARGGDNGGQRQGIGVVAAELVEQLADAERLGHTRRLEHDPDPLPCREVTRIATEESRRAACRAPQPGEHADRSRLAGAVGAEHGEQLAGADGEVDVLHGLDGRDASAEALARIAEFSQHGTLLGSGGVGSD